MYILRDEITAWFSVQLLSKASLSAAPELEVNIENYSTKDDSMKTLSKILINVLNGSMFFLAGISFFVYTGQPSLGDLVIFYSFISIAFLNGIRILILYMSGLNSVVNFLPFLSSFLIFIYMFSSDRSMFILVLIGISCLIQLFIILDYWFTGNKLRIQIENLWNDLIEYFSVDMEAKGWKQKD